MQTVTIKEEGKLDDIDVVSNIPTTYELHDDKLVLTSQYTCVIDDEKLGIRIDKEYKIKTMCKRESFSGIDILYHSDKGKWVVYINQAYSSIMQVFGDEIDAHLFYDKISKWIFN